MDELLTSDDLLEESNEGQGSNNPNSMIEDADSEEESSEEADSEEELKPLIESARDGDVDILQLWVDRNANLDEVDYETSPLCAAVHRGQIEAVTFLLNHEADVNRVVPEYDETALHVASQYKDIAMIDLLLDKGADINIANKDGDTPLHWVFTGEYSDNIRGAQHKATINRLIEKGADINIANEEGKTVLDCAVDDAIESLEKSYDDLDENDDIITLLVKKGAVVDEVDIENNHMFKYVTIYGNDALNNMLASVVKAKDLVTGENELDEFKNPVIDNNLVEKTLQKKLKTKILEQENFKSINSVFNEVKTRIAENTDVASNLHKMLESLSQDFEKDIAYLCSGVLQEVEGISPAPLQEFLNIYEDYELSDEGFCEELTELIDFYYHKLPNLTESQSSNQSMQDKLNLLKGHIHQINLDYLDEFSAKLGSVVLLQRIYDNMTYKNINIDANESSIKSLDFIQNIISFSKSKIQSEKSEIMLQEDISQSVSSSSSSSKRERDELDDEFAEDAPSLKAAKSELDFDDLNFMDFLPSNSDENTDPNANEYTELLGKE